MKSPQERPCQNISDSGLLNEEDSGKVYRQFYEEIKSKINSIEWIFEKETKTPHKVVQATIQREKISEEFSHKFFLMDADLREIIDKYDLEKYLDMPDFLISKYIRDNLLDIFCMVHSAKKIRINEQS